MKVPGSIETPSTEEKSFSTKPNISIILNPKTKAKEIDKKNKQALRVLSVKISLLKIYKQNLDPK